MYEEQCIGSQMAHFFIETSRETGCATFFLKEVYLLKFIMMLPQTTKQQGVI